MTQNEWGESGEDAEMFNPRYDDVTLSRLEGCVLHQLSRMRSGASYREMAVKIYGTDPREGQRSAANLVLRKLLQHGLVSVHSIPRVKRNPTQFGPSNISIYAVTRLGLDWLNHHPEAAAPFKPSRFGCRSDTVRIMQLPASAPAVLAPAPAPLNLKRYAYRPLPLRVRKVVGTPAHFWR